MNSEHFYQATTEHAYPLMLLTKIMYEQGFETYASVDRHCLASQPFKGALGEVAILSDAEGYIRQVMVGTGDGNNDALALAQAMNRLPQGCFVVQQPLSHYAQVTWALAQYRFDRYKPSNLIPRVLHVPADDLFAVTAEANAVFLVRDLINMPTNQMGPSHMAEVVAGIATKHGAQFTQWVGDELVRDNFPAIHAVGRAALESPRLLSLVWGNPNHPRVTLVGKGVCFDSGGLDIKPSSGMRLMKKDMGGAAHVIALAEWLMTLKLPIRLHVLVPAVENAISGNAYRPGDVLTMRNGLTVEIDNTDAEGRLVLADALVKACEEKPELIFNFATLTGAARVAVGTELAAMFTNDDVLAQALSAVAQQINDPVWRMPLFEGYQCMLDSSIADMTNSTASSYAGAITAALFLKRFIQDDVSWVHFDVMAWNVSNKPGKPEGGEAMGLRAVGHYLMQRYLS